MILVLSIGVVLVVGWYGARHSATAFFPFTDMMHGDMMGSGMHGTMHAVMHGGEANLPGGEIDDEVFEGLALEEQTEQWLRGTRGFENLVDRRTVSEVVVDVGAGDGLQYAPAAIRIAPGTTVRWRWTGQGGLHDVSFKNVDLKARLRGEEGAEFTSTFDEPGEYRYECTPHAGIGMRGVVVVSEN